MKYKFDWKYWKPFLQTNGKWSERKIKNELSDLVFIYKQVGKVYMELTGGLLSKPMYYADEIIAKNEEQLDEAVNQFKEDMLEDIKDMEKEEIIEYLKEG
jgi:hypothetical protein